MRGDQLAKIAQATLPSETITYSRIDTDFKNSILFLTKGVLQTSTADDLRALKKSGNILLFDPVDSMLPPDKAALADVIVAASQIALEDYRQHFAAPTILVDHHVDPRLKKLTLAERPAALKIGYFGELVNAVITPRIEEKVDFISVSTRIQNDEWLNHLSDYLLHYAVRNNLKTEGYKPFLKGFTAAHVGSNIIVQDTQDDAVRWLGNDYPYLLRGVVNEQSILDMLDYAHSSYDTETWQRGLKVMNTIKAKTSDGVIGKQFAAVIKAVK